ncbi:MAG TPA: hypothetical protein VKE41_01820 [Roseiflexaceae bacterium]|nr:hypothetical protein [Roseiflexaceae bacterium]
MIAVIVGAILSILGIVISVYQIDAPSDATDATPEVIVYEHWWMMLPM